MAGSPAWLSPEQIDGAKLTSATDLFSAGSLLHFAASGISPWGNQNTSTTSVVFNNILSKAPNTSKIPEPQRGLIEALLEKEVKSRPTAPQALKLLDSFGEDSPKAQIVSSTKVSQPKKVAGKSPSARKKMQEAKVARIKAFAGIVVWSLVAIVFVAPALFNQQPKFVCAETSYAPGDLSGATFSTLEETVFSNVLSRDCKPYSSSGSSLSYEHCHARSPEEPTTTGLSFKYWDYAEDQDADSKDIYFYQADSGRFGCRTFVQLGLMTEAESRFGFLGFSNEDGVPFQAKNGFMTSGESRYRLMFDGTSGTFVTRFFATDTEEISLSLTKPTFDRLKISSVESKSGLRAGVNMDYFWILGETIPKAEGTFCYESSWREEILSNGLSPKLEVNNAGNWVSAGEVQWADVSCDDNNKGSLAVLNLSTLLAMDPNPETCNEVRFEIPATPSSTRDRFTYCFYMEEY
jgi:hypothetical protein